MAGKRSIFEEVGAEAKRAEPPQGGMIDRGKGGARGGVRIWLAILFALVFAMVAVGGLTRLTDSGLSITEWRPVTGAMPPMTEADWQAEFQKYQQSPEFTEQNSLMDIAAFKSIYWWEWGHRQLGRVIGLVWALGFFGFLLARKMPPGWGGRLFGLGLLGGMQGAIGWWMVSSGLTGRMVDVASYRLAIHLGLAFAILGLIAWYMLSLARSDLALLQARRLREAPLATLATILAALAFLQILLGALVAGIDAGRAFPTWPMMGGSFLPADAFYLPDGGPAVLAFFENPGLVQFMHRMAGYLVFAVAIYVWWRGRASAHPATVRAFDWVAAMAFGQVVLGIVTVLYAAPLHLGLIHQLGAVVLWVLILRARHRAAYPIVQSVRGTR
ncbi:MAG TPA: COX15/CtaA family protein [Albidovulum sp.]|uniref:heme A synthase n=1 Tax=Albidovulum sp. TaxID=1872424 RepID=UPI002B8FF5CC|nr:COX15/CtaA family protein [Albidovulum sp.]